MTLRLHSSADDTGFSQQITWKFLSWHGVSLRSTRICVFWVCLHGGFWFISSGGGNVTFVTPSITLNQHQITAIFLLLAVCSGQSGETWDKSSSRMDFLYYRDVQSVVRGLFVSSGWFCLARWFGWLSLRSLTGCLWGVWLVLGLWGDFS